jgi:hypothetical protein
LTLKSHFTIFNRGDTFIPLSSPFDCKSLFDTDKDGGVARVQTWGGGGILRYLKCERQMLQESRGDGGMPSSGKILNFYNAHEFYDEV